MAVITINPSGKELHMNSKPLAASRPAPDLLKQSSPQQDTVFRILLAISFVHLLMTRFKPSFPRFFRY
ncbi:hypothetical protein J6TS7_10400 [Paenibacillus dendritiformis]|nr:hypothetical protein J6TS7_10400 [Paenibacillus dendritiformis]